MIAYRCRALISMSGPPIENGAFVVDRTRFEQVGPAKDILPFFSGKVVDLGDVVALPGLINAHCHLEYTLMRGAIMPSRSFSKWVSRINALKRSLTDDDYLRATRQGLEELQRSGVTSVLDIVSAPQVLLRLTPPAIRTWFFLELIDVRPRPWLDDHAFGSWLFFEQNPGWMGGFGLSPHAPYTASKALYESALSCAALLQMPVTTHVAESGEEFEMFATAKGSLFEFLKKMGRPMEDCGGKSPLRHLITNGLLHSGCIVVHLNELDQQDLQLLSTPEWRNLAIVHCPKSHRFLHHKSFPLEELRKRGLQISLGTDSLASNDSLNLFSEMRMARRNYPSLTPEELLRMTTVYPARAIRQENFLGRIARGYLADAVCIPFSDTLQNVHEAVLDNRSPIKWIMVNGKVVG
jgi:aminodeoxyfutalosine deaminase